MDNIKVIMSPDDVDNNTEILDDQNDGAPPVKRTKIENEEGDTDTDIKPGVSELEDVESVTPSQTPNTNDNGTSPIPAESPNHNEEDATTTPPKKEGQSQSPKKKKKKKKKPIKDVGKEKTPPTVKSAKKKSKATHLRRNIKDILNTDNLGEETLAAQREEAERRERMNLKLQQLKMMQAHLQSSSASSSLSLSMASMPPLGESPPLASEELVKLDAFVDSGAEAVTQRLTYSQDPLPYPQNAEMSLVSGEEIVLSSDEELTEKNNENMTPNFSDLRAHLSQMRNKKPDADIIAISSDEEDTCDREVGNFTNRTNFGRIPYPCNNKKSGLDKEDSDDDCVVISPTPDSEDPDKEEKNLDELNVPDSLGRVLVNVGHPDEDPDIFLAPQITRIVKPHQIGGIRFLYDNVVESADRFNTASGFGCILAHSMGLGKTLQAVAFCDVFLRASRAKTVLIIVPINTIQNWLNEFNIWLPSKNAKIKKAKKENKTDSPAKSTPPQAVSDDSLSDTVSLSFESTLNLLGNEESKDAPEDEGEIQPRNFQVFVLNETVKTLQAREKIIAEWSSNGGVMLIGYEMYRMLALKKLKRSGKKSSAYNGELHSQEAISLSNIYACLVDPGPDLVICDEGHRIKNSGASISQALKAIRTRRRVVLTGYPLQNNLIEYWCMVDFIRPNYLGSKVEFSNMFERPISNGQCVDSTPQDRKLMRYRSHVLHSLLEGFVQRRSHAVLQHALPQKQEWVFLLKMTPIQYRLYKEFMQYLSDNLSDGQSGANPIKAFAVCCKIWNHPDALYNVVKKKQGVFDDLDLDDISSNGFEVKKGRKGGLRKGMKQQEKEVPSPLSFFDGSGFDFRRNNGYSGRAGSEQSLSLDWSHQIFENYQPGVLGNSVKFELLFAILEETAKLNDKVLVFSQTLMSLDLIESFLQYKFNWAKNAEYYRLDGSTTGLERERLINSFNAKADVFVFLVSTRAGSLGVNLTGANRVIVLDASWNPCHDCQAVCRVYRYGQTKPCQIYRFVSDCTLEKRIYDRQINKRGMSDRVVDEMNPNAQFKTKDVSSFLVLKHDLLDKLPYIQCDLNPDNYSDPVLRSVLLKHGERLTQEPFEHESLLIDQKSQRLSATEKRLAHRNYLSEKRTAELQTASGYTYSRPSYAAYYPKAGTNNSPVSSNSGLRQGPSSSYLNSSPALNLLNRPEDSFERHVPALRAKGICVQSIVLKKDSFLSDPGGGPDMYLMAGEKIYVLRSDKGTYLRISNGKLIAVRNNIFTTKYPNLNVPANQELSREGLQALVYSFLKLPGHLYKGDYDSPPRFPPTEQPLPASASFFTQNKNHLMVRNPSSNSGGDVTLWPHSSDPNSLPLLNHLVQNQSCSGRGTDLGQGGSLLPSFDFNSSRTNPNLERLSLLANYSGGSRGVETMSPQFPNHTMGQPFPVPNSAIDRDDLEVIPLSTSNGSSNGSRPSISTGGNVYPHPRSETDKGQMSSSNAGPSFYEDFTITVKNSANYSDGFFETVPENPIQNVVGNESEGNDYFSPLNHNQYYNNGGGNSRALSLNETDRGNSFFQGNSNNAV